MIRFSFYCRPFSCSCLISTSDIVESLSKMMHRSINMSLNRDERSIKIFDAVDCSDEHQLSSDRSMCLETDFSSIRLDRATKPDWVRDSTDNERKTSCCVSFVMPHLS